MIIQRDLTVKLAEREMDVAVVTEIVGCVQ